MDLEWQRQNMCGELVSRHVESNVSYLVSNLLEIASSCPTRNLDYDELLRLSEWYDYEEAANDFIRDQADFDDLENIAEQFGYWKDILDELNIPDTVYPPVYWVCSDCLQALENGTYDGLDDERQEEVESGVDAFDSDATLVDAESEFMHARCDCCNTTLAGERFGYSDGVEEVTDFEDRLTAAKKKDPDVEDKLREKISALVDDPKWVCDEYNVDMDDYRGEVYEHWIVDYWLASRLSEQGEVVGDVFGLRVWGRGCTGQAIKLDNVIRTICANLNPHDWNNLKGETNE